MHWKPIAHREVCCRFAHGTIRNVQNYTKAIKSLSHLFSKQHTLKDVMADESTPALTPLERLLWKQYQVWYLRYFSLKHLKHKERHKRHLSIATSNLFLSSSIIKEAHLIPLLQKRFVLFPKCLNIKSWNHLFFD